MPLRDPNGTEQVIGAMQMRLPIVHGRVPARIESVRQNEPRSIAEIAVDFHDILVGAHDARRLLDLRGGIAGRRPIASGDLQQRLVAKRGGVRDKRFEDGFWPPERADVAGDEEASVVLPLRVLVDAHPGGLFGVACDERERFHLDQVALHVRIEFLERDDVADVQEAQQLALLLEPPPTLGVGDVLAVQAQLLQELRLALQDDVGVARGGVDVEDDVVGKVS